MRGYATLVVGAGLLLRWPPRGRRRRGRGTRGAGVRAAATRLPGAAVGVPRTAGCPPHPSVPLRQVRQRASVRHTRQVPAPAPASAGAGTGTRHRESVRAYTHSLLREHRGDERSGPRKQASYTKSSTSCMTEWATGMAEHRRGLRGRDRRRTRGAGGGAAACAAARRGVCLGSSGPCHALVCVGRGGFGGANGVFNARSGRCSTTTCLSSIDNLLLKITLVTRYPHGQNQDLVAERVL